MTRAPTVGDVARMLRELPKRDRDVVCALLARMLEGLLMSAVRDEPNCAELHGNSVDPQRVAELVEQALGHRG